MFVRGKGKARINRASALRSGENERERARGGKSIVPVPFSPPPLLSLPGLLTLSLSLARSIPLLRNTGGELLFCMRPLEHQVHAKVQSRKKVFSVLFVFPRPRIQCWSRILACSRTIFNYTRTLRVAAFLTAFMAVVLLYFYDSLQLLRHFLFSVKIFALFFSASRSYIISIILQHYCNFLLARGQIAVPWPFFWM